MKKLLTLLVIILLSFALVGCGDDGNYWRAKDYYTQEEVDELIQNAIDELGDEIESELPQVYYSKNEVDQIIQNEIDELELIIDNLEEIIFENQRRLDEMQQPCYLFELIGDYQKALDDGFTFTIIDGVMYEYKDGIATGDSWIEEDIIADYCNIYD